MTRDEVLQRLADHRHELNRFHLHTFALFGSVARNESDADSDLDFVVEFIGPATFDRYLELLQFLENLFGKPVDLLTRSLLTPSLCASIDREALYVSLEHNRSLYGSLKPFIRRIPAPEEDWHEAVAEAIAEEYRAKWER